MFGYDINGVKAVVGVIIAFLMGLNVALILIWRELNMIRRAARYAAIRERRAGRKSFEQAAPVAKGMALTATAALGTTLQRASDEAGRRDRLRASEGTSGVAGIQSEHRTPDATD